jgi:putative tryptophan/tyrosine transport system substrate-binding protein
MKPYIFYVGLGSMFLALCFSVEAQQPATAPKLGYLAFRSVSDPAPGRELFERELRLLGYVEGKNIVIEHRSAEGKLDRLPAVADDLIRLKVNALVTSSTPAAIALKNATRTIPIVFTSVADPIAAGLVDRLAKPGGNITGFTEISEVLAGKRLELVKETIPKLSRVAVLWNPRNPGNAQQWKESQIAAGELGLQLYSIEASSTDKYDGAFKEAVKAGSAALAVAQDLLANIHLKLIADLAAKYRLPSIYSRGDFVTSGGLMAYGPDQTEPYKRAAVMVDKILKGTKPSDIPVEQPTKFEFVINLKTAKQIGLTIPPNVLARADRVIK